MADLTTYTLAQVKQQLVEQFITALFQDSPDTPPANTDVGATLGAAFNSEAMLFLLGQSNIAYAIAVARLSTSTGADVDSFCTPFGIIRLGPIASSGTVVFATSSPASVQILIPPGTIVMTPGGSLPSSGTQFVVIADPSQSAWNPTVIPGGAYVIQPSQSSVDVTVQCTAAGSIGNVLANTITVLSGSGTPIPSIASVTNPDAFTNGVDKESDQAYIARFTLAVSSGRVATANAIGAAILGVQTGLTYSYGDRVNQDGTEHDAYFTAVVNELGQNTGPSSALLSACEAAVESVRSGGISYQVIAPTIIQVAAVATITVQSGYSSSVVISACETAYETFLNNIGLDPSGNATKCPYGKVYAILFGVPGVADVQSLTLNSGTSDISAPFANQLVAGTTTFTPG